MQKFFLTSFVILIIFIATGESKATYNGVLLGETNIYKDLTLKSGNILKEMIILPNENFNEIEVIKIIERLDSLPRKTLQKANQQGIKVVLFQGKLTDHQSASHLKGKVPRGYTDHSILWDNVPGIGGSKTVLVKIGSSDKGNGHGSVNLEFHELAHSLQHYVFNDEQSKLYISFSWTEEAPNMFAGQAYLVNYEEEFFAESFAYYFYSDFTRNELKKFAPKTYEFFARLN